MRICPRPHRSPSWLCAAALALGLLSPATFAGGLFRCSGSNGELAYTNKPAGYQNCVKVAGYADTAAKPVSAPPAPVAPPRAPTVTAGNATQPGQWQYRETTPDAAATVAKPVASATPAAEPKVLRGSVYKVTKANGTIEYTNIRPAGKHQLLFTYISTCYACDVRSKVNFRATPLNRDAYRAEIAAAAAEFGVDEALIRAVVHAESHFNVNALSKKGAQGLMQLMPGTAGDLGVANPFDPVDNIRGGAQYLSGLLRSFQGNERLAVAAYNAGPRNVEKYGDVPPFDETRVYVDRVATLRARYQAN